MRYDWRNIEGEFSPVQETACAWDFTDDTDVQMLDVDGLDERIPSVVDFLANRTGTGFDTETLIKAVTMLRFDPELRAKGRTAVEGKTVQGFDTYGLMQDALALVDMSLSIMDFGKKYDGELEQPYPLDIIEDFYVVRLLIQRLRNGQGRRIREFYR